MGEIKVAILGLGNVGRAFVRYVEKTGNGQKTEIRICAMMDSSGGFFINKPEQINSLLAYKDKGRSIRDFAPGDFISEPHRFIESLQQAGVSVLVESLPTNLKDGQPALDLVKQALGQGTSVVTVDKGPLAHGFDELIKTAQATRARLGFSGTTGVKIPAETAQTRVLEIRGILNGTTNHILTEMQEGSLSYDEALSDAQAKGIAEPDASLDTEGWDTAVKILILAKALMGADATVNDVSRIGIGPETETLIQVGRRSNRIVRLAGRARIWQGRVRVSVAPKLLNPDSPFYAVRGTSKAALFRTENRGELLSFARSGRDAISQIILDDIRALREE